MSIARLETASVGYPVTRLGVSFFPVYLAANDLPEIATEGLVIEELESATVPELIARNPTGTPILLVEGEQLVGGKQNRILNTTVLAPPDSELHIPVSCVERGRWGREQAYRRGVFRAHPSVRSRLQESLDAPWPGADPRHGDQGAVWAEVDGVLGRLGVRSATGSMADAEEVLHRDRARSGAVEELVRLGPLPRQNGVVISHGPRVKGIELFGATGLLAAHWDTLVRSWLLEAPGAAGDPSAARALWAIRRLAFMSMATSNGVGLGTQLRGKDRVMVAQALMLDDATVHASGLFTAPERRRAGASVQEPDRQDRGASAKRRA